MYMHHHFNSAIKTLYIHTFRSICAVYCPTNPGRPRNKRQRRDEVGGDRDADAHLPTCSWSLQFGEWGWDHRATLWCELQSRQQSSPEYRVPSLMWNIFHQLIARRKLQHFRAEKQQWQIDTASRFHCEEKWQEMPDWQKQNPTGWLINAKKFCTFRCFDVSATFQIRTNFRFRHFALWLLRSTNSHVFFLSKIITGLFRWKVYYAPAPGVCGV